MKPIEGEIVQVQASPIASNDSGNDNAPVIKRDRLSPEVRARVNANLKHWPKGVSGNPKGRLPAGLSYIEWVNVLAGKKEAKLREIAKDRKQPAAKRAAAKQCLLIMSDAAMTNGQPLAGEAIDRLIDRTVGKAIARTEISGPEGSPIQVEQRVTDLAECLRFYEDQRKANVE